MGMTIDEAIAIIENPTDYFPKDIEETKHFMIETMYKYQKIEQIVADRKGKLVLDTLVAIIKVVEDGNVD